MSGFAVVLIVLGAVMLTVGITGKQDDLVQAVTGHPVPWS